MSSSFTGSASGVVFSPYVDMTLTMDENIVAMAKAANLTHVTLAFIQSYGSGLGWGGLSSLDNDTLANGTSIQTVISQLQNNGVGVTISFGGSAGTDPATVATSASALQAEYQSVITRYNVTSLDFDVEGAALANSSANQMRATALAALEAQNPSLTVSFTLPVLPSGLTQDGVNLLEAAISAGAKIGTVNLMAMDYGSANDNGGQMGLDAIDAIKSVEAQLDALGLTSTTIGITPMIGQNDTAGEVFTLADAQQLADYVKTDSRVTEVSMWSLARDNGSEAGATWASPTGSGLSQSDYAFSEIFEKVEDVACFYAGTRIDTPHGAVAVEQLAIGDEVITRFAGRQRIKWIGRSSYEGPALRDNPLLLPVRIAPGALGAGEPRSTLTVSPGHAICIEGALVPAWRLVNGVSITQTPQTSMVHYFHLEFEHHDLLCTEGVWSESFLNEVSRDWFENGAEYADLYPGEDRADKPCLPRLEEGFGLLAIQHRLARRAGVQPEPQSDGPLVGAVDVLRPDLVTGWAASGAAPVTLLVMAGGEILACLPANRFRPELRNQGRERFRQGFRCVLPAQAKGAISVRRALDGAALPRA